MNLSPMHRCVIQSLQPKVEKMEAAWARLHTITGAETPEEVIAYFEGAHCNCLLQCPSCACPSMQELQRALLTLAHLMKQDKYSFDTMHYGWWQRLSFLVIKVISGWLKVHAAVHKGLPSGGCKLFCVMQD